MCPAVRPKGRTASRHGHAPKFGPRRRPRLQNRVVARRVRHRLFQPGVVDVEPLEPKHLAGVHETILAAHARAYNCSPILSRGVISTKPGPAANFVSVYSRRNHDVLIYVPHPVHTALLPHRGRRDSDRHGSGNGEHVNPKKAPAQTSHGRTMMTSDQMSLSE